MIPDWAEKALSTPSKYLDDDIRSAKEPLNYHPAVFSLVAPEIDLQKMGFAVHKQYKKRGRPRKDK